MEKNRVLKVTHSPSLFDAPRTEALSLLLVILLAALVRNEL